MKQLFKTLLYVVLVLVVAVAAFLATAVITDYKPDEKTVVAQNQQYDEFPDTLEFSVLSWNLGYCGLSEDMDFFYDGGKQTRPKKATVENNLKEIIKFLKSKNDVNFFLFQEVDKKSKRSYYINEIDSLKKEFSNCKVYYGKNYDVFYVPYPLKSPYGSVNGGLLTLSQLQAPVVTRHSFPSSYDFPLKYFMLDRCFLVTRIKVSNGKELLLINTHNSAYDDGSLRQAEMQFLKNFLLAEYEKGNYVMVGGDWNQCPPKLQHKIEGFVFDSDDLTEVPEDYMPADWKWVFKNNVPTNRRVYQMWDKKTTKTTIIDYFLISPNIEKISMENINLNFKNSDHNPVLAKFKLK